MKLNDQRNLLNNIDEKISKLLNERFLIIEEIKKIKQKENIEITDLKREKEVISKNEKYVYEDYQKDFHKVYQMILKVSKDIQKR